MTISSLVEEGDLIEPGILSEIRIRDLEENIEK